MNDSLSNFMMLQSSWKLFSTPSQPGLFIFFPCGCVHELNVEIDLGSNSPHEEDGDASNKDWSQRGTKDVISSYVFVENEHFCH